MRIVNVLLWLVFVLLIALGILSYKWGTEVPEELHGGFEQVQIAGVAITTPMGSFGLASLLLPLNIIVSAILSVGKKIDKMKRELAYQGNSF